MAMLEGQTVNLVLVFVFLFFSAFFSSSEAAFLSLQRTRIMHLVSIQAAGASRVARMIDEPERLLSTILLGNNLANVAFAALVTAITFSLIDDQGTGIVVSTAVGTADLLLVGEIIPKSLAVHRGERVAFLYARPLKWIELLFLPVVTVLHWITTGVVAIFGVRGGTRRSLITEAEIRTLIDVGEAEGTFEPSEAEMLEKVFRFGDRQVREVMTPRTEIAFLERDATLGEFLDVYAEHSHTRFPVYKGTEDNVIGILSAKDILKAMSARTLPRDSAASVLIRDAFFVPETKRIAELFDELRDSGNQMAIAIDEFGGLAGLVTLKRLLEEVVGRVGEEGASPEEEFEAIDENTFQVDGGMSMDEVREQLGISLSEGDFETIAGFVLDRLGHIPTVGEQLDYGNVKIEITEMRNLKIETIKRTRRPVVEEPAPG